MNKILTDGIYKQENKWIVIIVDKYRLYFRGPDHAFVAEPATFIGSGREQKVLGEEVGYDIDRVIKIIPEAIHYLFLKDSD